MKRVVRLWCASRVRDDRILGCTSLYMDASPACQANANGPGCMGSPSRRFKCEPVNTFGGVAQGLGLGRHTLTRLDLGRRVRDQTPPLCPMVVLRVL